VLIDATHMPEASRLSCRCSKHNLNHSSRPVPSMIPDERTRTRLWRESNQSLSAPGIPAGKTFAEARDRGGIFDDTCRFPTTETALSRVFGRQSRGKLMTISTAARKRLCVGLRGGAGRPTKSLQDQ
jgi:hypothetical protein